jgi:putative IMPACT (imprinted ancient) family translation regulator
MHEKMIEPAKILTVKEFYESKFKQKGSIFIGQVYPVVQEKQAEEILASVRKKWGAFRERRSKDFKCHPSS